MKKNGASEGGCTVMNWEGQVIRSFDQGPGRSERESQADKWIDERARERQVQMPWGSRGEGVSILVN